MKLPGTAHRDTQPRGTARRSGAPRLLTAAATLAVVAVPFTLAPTATAATTETLVATCAPSLPISHPGCGTTYTVGSTSTGLQEIRGGDRYATAVNAALTGFPDADVVVLVSGENDHLVDALSAAPLARSLAAPVLLTAGTELSGATADYLRTQRPDAVLVIGGEPSVATTVLDRVRDLGVTSVGRVDGADRYATSRNVAALMPAATHAWVASGENNHLVDALAASGTAARLAEPLVIAPATGDASATAAHLRTASITTTTVVGGDNAVSPAVAAQFPASTRASGDSRWTTAKAIADDAVGRGVSATDIVVSNGENNHLVDALAAAPLGRITLLTGNNHDAGSDVVTSWLSGGNDRRTFVGAAANDLVCWGVRDCSRVSTTDVTGDGVLDDVALVGRPGEMTHQVRVRADGNVATAVVESESSAYAATWLGATQVDGVAGNELLFLAGIGAHAERYTMLTWRNDALTVEAAPDGGDDPLWYVDASAYLNTSVTCDVPGDVTVKWTDSDENGDLYGAWQPYRYEGGTWVEVGDLFWEYLPDGPTAECSGWNCAGLPRFATIS